MATRAAYTLLNAAVLLALSGCAGDLPTPWEPPTELQAKVYFVSDSPEGLRLVSELRTFEATEESLPMVVLTALVSGELTPLDADYQNLWAAPNGVAALELAGTAAIVDMVPVSLNVGAEGEAAAINQIVWTLTEINPEIESVSFLIDGSPAESFAGHVDLMTDFQRGAEFEVLSSLQIDFPAEGSILSGPVTVSGAACTFEANLIWTLLRNGKILEEGSTLAAEACPVRSPWSVDFVNLDNGHYVFVAQAFSPKDGGLLVQDDKSFRVK